MGIVKISEQMHENLRLSSTALSRSINAQAEHWLRIGMLSELNPHLNHQDINQLLIRLSLEDHFDLTHCLNLTPLNSDCASNLPKESQS